MFKENGIHAILVIEDNPGDFVLIENCLAEQYMAPVTYHAKTFKEAKFLLTEEDIKFDVILLDLSLPDKSGTALITDIVSISKNCPVIILTGYSDIEFSIKSLSLGISDYLWKEDLSCLTLQKSMLYSIERKKILLTLEASEKRHSDLFQLSPNPTWVYDVDSLDFLYVNEAAVKQYGYCVEEFLSMTINQISLAEDIPFSKKFVVKPTQRQNKRLHFNAKQYVSNCTNTYTRHMKKNGEIMYVDIYSRDIVFNGRQAKLIAAMDITEKIKHTKAIEMQNKQLREIAWIQSHVVRAPLSQIMGIATLIKEINAITTEGEELLSYLLNACDKLDVIIKEIANKSDCTSYNASIINLTQPLQAV